MGLGWIKVSWSLRGNFTWGGHINIWFYFNCGNSLLISIRADCFKSRCCGVIWSLPSGNSSPHYTHYIVCIITLAILRSLSPQRRWVSRNIVWRCVYFFISLQLGKPTLTIRIFSNRRLKAIEIRILSFDGVVLLGGLSFSNLQIC